MTSTASLKQPANIYIYIYDMYNIYIHMHMQVSVVWIGGLKKGALVLVEG